MSQPYHRTEAQKLGDFMDARQWEIAVGSEFLEPFRSDFNHPDRLDMWFPEMYLELKEKKQRYTERWHLLPGVPEENLFIIDELTVKRALQHYPGVLFLIRDRPQGRLFYAPIWEVVSVERARVNRVNKGKWVIDLSNFRQVDSATRARTWFLSEMVNTAWKNSSIASHKEIAQA